MLVARLFVVDSGGAPRLPEVRFGRYRTTPDDDAGDDDRMPGRRRAPA